MAQKTSGRTTPPRRIARRSALIALAAITPFAAACSSGHDKDSAAESAIRASADTPAPRTAACRPVPPAGATLPWLPPDLTLPKGSFAVQDVDAAAPPPSMPASGSHRGLIAVQGSVDDFVSFIHSDWTTRGWSLGKGDSEQGEAEGGFRRGDVGGAYRVRDVYCDPSYTELLLVYSPAPAAVTP